jgi:hypothetical protein
MNEMTFDERRTLALHILGHGDRLTRKAGQFLGQCAVDPTPLSDKQFDWLLALAERVSPSVES